MRRFSSSALAVALLGLLHGPSLAVEPEPIPLVGGAFTPSPTAEGFDFLSVGGTVQIPEFALVQIDGTLTRRIEDLLHTNGVELLRHVYGRSYLVRVKSTPAKLSRITSDGGILLARIPGRVKISSTSQAWVEGSTGGSAPFLIRFHSGLSDEDAQRAFSAVRPGLVAVRSKRCNCWTATLTSAELKRLAEHNAICSIEPDIPVIVPLVDKGRVAAGVDAVQLFAGTASSYTFGGLSGDGVTGAILDVGGVPDAQPVFASIDTGGAKTTSRVTNLATASVMPIVAAHTTHVGAIIAGNGWGSSGLGLGDWQLRGVAPNARLVAIAIPDRNLEGFWRVIGENGSAVTNNSYALVGRDSIELFANLFDDVVRGVASYVVSNTEQHTISSRPAVFAAGNNGTPPTGGAADDWIGYYSILNPTKNGIVVGGSLIDVVNGGSTATQRASCSSIGPTFDGRLKPDLMAPACKDDTEPFFEFPTLKDWDKSVYSAERTCGTSYSAAYTTGVILLMLQQWNSSHADPPYPSTIKAALINSATDMTGSSNGPTLDPGNGSPTTLAVNAFPGPDFATGYGEISAKAAVDTIAEGRFREATALPAPHPTVDFPIQVSAGTPLRVTLAWDDDSTNCTTMDAKQLQNDLDLVLIPPSNGEPVKPLRLPACPRPGSQTMMSVPSCANVAATEGEDHDNNVEQVTIANPAAGTWTARVTTYHLAIQDPQFFSLASSAPFAPEIDPQTLEAAVGPLSILNDDVAGQAVVPLAPLAAGRAAVVPLGPVCSKAHCAPCGRYGECPGVELRFDQFAAETRFQIVDGRGRPMGTVVTKGHRITLTWPRSKPDGAFLIVKPDVAAGTLKRPPRFHATALTR